MSRLKNLIHEIHRRFLWQVLLVCLGVPWVVLKVVHALTEGLGSPSWVPRFTLSLLLVGFPIIVASTLVQKGWPKRLMSRVALAQFSRKANRSFGLGLVHQNAVAVTLALALGCSAYPGGTANLGTAPDTILLVDATAIANGVVEITWRNYSSNVEGFYIERCEGSGCGDFEIIARVPSNSNVYYDEGVLPSTYSYRIRATNRTGSSVYSNIDHASAWMFSPEMRVFSPETMILPKIRDSSMMRRIANLPNGIKQYSIGWEVVLNVWVNVDGRASLDRRCEPHVRRSSGDQKLDQALLLIVLQSQFDPGSSGGRKEPMCAPVSISSRGEISPGGLTGVVADEQTRDVLVGVQVYVEGTGRGAVSDIDGRFLIDNVPSGTHTVVAELLGYRTSRIENVVVASKTNQTVNFELTPSAIEVEAIQVETEATPEDTVGPIHVGIPADSIAEDPADSAVATYNRPLQVVLKRPHPVVLRLNVIGVETNKPIVARMEVETVQKVLAAKRLPGASDTVLSITLPVYDSMEAKLTSDKEGMFKIEADPAYPVVQEPGTTGKAEWRWTVTPLECERFRTSLLSKACDSQTLTVSLRPWPDTLHFVPVLADTISVRITVGQLVTRLGIDYAWWVLLAVVPLVAYGLARRIRNPPLAWRPAALSRVRRARGYSSLATPSPGSASKPPDIFLSYSRDDRERVLQLAEILQHVGWEVWWDSDILHGQEFDEAIERALDTAKCVLVIWSSTSVKSEWVKAEAAEAAAQNKLIPVCIDDVEIPLEFRRKQTAMVDLPVSPEDPEFQKLLKSIESLVGPGERQLGIDN